MSNAVLNRIRHAQLTTAQKIILLLLADYADDSGCTHNYASHDRLAFEGCLSKRALINNIQELERQQIVFVDRSNGAQNTYRINPEFAPEPRKTARQTSVMICTSAAYAPVQHMHEPVHLVHQTSASGAQTGAAYAPITSNHLLTSNHQEDLPEKDSKTDKPKKAKFDPLAIDLPANVSPKLWAEFVTMRKEIKKPVSTERAANGLINQLARLPEPNASLQQSIDNCWQGVFAVKAGSAYAAQPSQYAANIPASRSVEVAPMLPPAKLAEPIKSNPDAKAQVAAYLEKLKAQGVAK